MKMKIYIGIVVFLLMISTVPLLNLSRYAHPSADDYGLAINTRKEWIENHSVVGLLKEAHSTQKELCQSWEGTYTSYYIWALQPGIFGERYYKLTGFINIALLGFAVMVFFVVLARYIFKAKVIYGISLGCLALLMMLQWMPSAVEGLYWYCGAVGYNFFWSVVLLMLAGIIIYSGEKKMNIVMIAFIILGGILLGGGNHVTSFAGMLIFAIIGILSIICKDLKKYRISFMAFIVTTVGFLFNVLSPGTAVRSNFFPDKAGIAETIWLALQNGIMYIGEWITLPFIFFIFLLIPFAVKTMSEFIETNSFEFKNPLLVFAFSVGYICALFCPTLYVMKNTGAGRVQNTIYFSFIILVILNVFYDIGYLLIQMKKSGIIPVWKEKIPAKFIVLLAVVLAGILIQPIKTSNGYLAAETIESGEAAQYSDEAQTRYELALENEGKDLELMDFTVKPELLFFDDIKLEGTAGNNVTYAEYYNLKSVVLKYWD